MGLQNQLSDVSSESVLVLTAVLVAQSVRYLRSLFFTILHAVGVFSPRFHSDDEFQSSRALYDVVGSGLAGINLLCEQLNLNRLRSCPNQSEYGGGDRLDSDCVVCLNRMGDGEPVRTLACRHAFHKDCFEGWLEHMNFSCPLCRAPLVTEEHVDCTRRRVAVDLLECRPLQ